MKLSKKALLTAVLLVAGTGVVQAACGITAGRVSIVGNEFPAIKSVAAKAAECAGGKVTVKANLTADHQKINVAGMQGNPAEYTSAIIANSSIIALMNEGLIRPLDDLVKQHGQSLSPNQLIKIDGKVMAVAFMANAQHLIYRKDILEKAGVPVPTTYEDMLAGAKVIRDKGLMQYPLSGAYKSGWNLAQEFINMYIGYDGDFYKPGTAEVSINNAKGVKTLETLKALTQYMNPDFLTHDSNAAAAEWEAGKVAMMNFWGSRTAVLQDDKGSTKEVYSNTLVSGPLTVGGGKTPATTLWWDGFTVAKNISDEDAVATFKALVNGVSPGLLNDKTMPEAVWMINGYKPAPVAAGVFATIKAGATPYPMRPYHGLLHTALGDNLSDYLQGKESAQQALSDIEAAYTAAAKEKGFLKR